MIPDHQASRETPRTKTGLSKNFPGLINITSIGVNKEGSDYKPKFLFSIMRLGVFSLKSAKTDTLLTTIYRVSKQKM